MKRTLLIVFVILLSSFLLKAQDDISSKQKSSIQESTNFVCGGYSWLNDSDNKFIDLSFQRLFSINKGLHASYQLDAGIGLDNQMAQFFLDLTPGLSIFIVNKSNLFVKADLGAGISILSPKEGDGQTGISSLLKVSLGYDFIGVYTQVNYHQFKTGGFERFSVGLSFQF